jgi:hypothetical protein
VRDGKNRVPCPIDGNSACSAAVRCVRSRDGATAGTHKFLFWFKRLCAFEVDFSCLMSMSCPRVLALAVAALSAGCSFADETLLPRPSLEAADPRGADSAPAAVAPSAVAPSAAAPAPSAPAALPRATSTSTSTVAPAQPSGGKVAMLRTDMQHLQDDVASHMAELQRLRRQLDEIAATEEGLVGGVETRLKSTNVPNDPQLSGDVGQAQAQLVNASGSIARLNNIASWGTSDAALASYVQQAIRAAAGDPGTTDPDRRLLARLEIDAGRASAAVDQLVTQTSGEIAGRSLFLAQAHRRLAALGSDIALGQRDAAQRAASQLTASQLTGGQISAAPPRAAPAAATDAPSGGTGGRRALVTIRFDRPDVAYEQELFSAVKEALDRRPGVAFDIVAVAPPGQAQASAAAAEHNVESVVRSLGSMGLPPDRFRLSAATLADASGNEVRIYAR